MGKYRFKLSDMIPNAWFYKLKDMGRTRKTKSPDPTKKKPPSWISQKPHMNPRPRCSYYFTTNPTTSGKLHVSSPSHRKSMVNYFPDPSRRSSSKERAKRKTIYKPSPKLASYAVDTTLDPLQVESSDCFISSKESSPEPDYLREQLHSESENDAFAATDLFKGTAKYSGPYCAVTSSATDIIIDINDTFFTSKPGKFDEYDKISVLDLPPILTKPRKLDKDQSKSLTSSTKQKDTKSRKSFSVKVVHEKTHSLARKSSANSAGIRLRSNSPKIASKKLKASARKSVSYNTGFKVKNKNLTESFAVVKSSYDPQKDFRDSMTEMIAENNIKAPEDLEDLLACYLSLNNNEYHPLIIKAFEQIWFNMAES